MKMMMRRAALCAFLLVTALVATGHAQQPAPPAPKLTTFKVEVTLTRMQGAKELGSSPYSLVVPYDNRGYNRGATLRIGVDVPTGTVTNAGNGRTETAFKTVGTQIDASVSPFDEARFAVDISISDTAIFSDGTDADQVALAKTQLDAAERSLARAQALFQKQLTTKEALAAAEAQAQGAKVRLAMAEKGTKSFAHADQMAFRSFTSQNRVYLRDGESQEMTVATDRTSGETVKASVKLTIVR
jgi:hypothetical protein